MLHPSILAAPGHFNPFHVLQLMSPLLILGKADGGRLYVGAGKALPMVDQEVRYK